MEEYKDDKEDYQTLSDITINRYAIKEIEDKPQVQIFDYEQIESYVKILTAGGLTDLKPTFEQLYDTIVNEHIPLEEICVYYEIVDLFIDIICGSIDIALIELVLKTSYEMCQADNNMKRVLTNSIFFEQVIDLWDRNGDMYIEQICNLITDCQDYYKDEIFINFLGRFNDMVLTDCDLIEFALQTFNKQIKLFFSNDQGLDWSAHVIPILVIVNTYLAQGEYNHTINIFYEIVMNSDIKYHLQIVNNYDIIINISKNLHEMQPNLLAKCLKILAMIFSTTLSFIHHIGNYVDLDFLVYLFGYENDYVDSDLCSEIRSLSYEIFKLLFQTKERLRELMNEEYINNIFISMNDKEYAIREKSVLVICDVLSNMESEQLKYIFTIEFMENLMNFLDNDSDKLSQEVLYAFYQIASKSYDAQQYIADHMWEIHEMNEGKKITNTYTYLLQILLDYSNPNNMD